MEHVNVNILSDEEFNSLVGQTWPEKSGFACAAEFEWCHDSDYYHPDMTGKPYEDLQEWLDDDLLFGPSSYEVIDSLIAAGKLQPGNYLVQVSGGNPAAAGMQKSMQKGRNMFEYEIEYIDGNMQRRKALLEAVGLAEVVDLFIETYCPVQSIESVVKSASVEYPVSRERMPA